MSGLAFAAASRGAGVNPATFTLSQLAAIRGAMWPQTGPNLLLPFGPRPYQPDNILATDFLWNYPPELRLPIVRQLRAWRYTHAVVGPVVDSDGYHGMWEPNDWRTKFDQWLDMHQFLWDNGITPVSFIHPDGWTLEETIELTPLFRSARAQRLMRIVVPTGWEPTRYSWSSVTWSLFCQWARQTWPNALVLIHTVTEVDGPVGVDERWNDNNNPNGNGDGWARVTPFLHGWLIQNGAYETSAQDDPDTAYNFAGQFDTGSLGAATHGAAWHFAREINGWPKGSAFGPDVRIRLYNAECTSFVAFWQRPNAMSEAQRQSWGDLAINAGAHGYLDGGTLYVPFTP